MSEHIDTFPTSDIGLTSFLICKGHKLLNSTKEGGSRRVTFHFPPSSSLEETIALYINRGEVIARDFLHTLRDLKGTIRQ